MDPPDLHDLDLPGASLPGYVPDKHLLRKVLRRRVVAETQSILDTIAARLQERLSLLSQSPTRLLDLGTGDARHLPKLQQQFSSASVIGADLGLARLRNALKSRRFWQKRPMLVCLDACETLPFEDDSFDLIVSNMLLPWIFEPNSLMTEINRVMVTDGAFFLSTAGPDTLFELRQAWAEVDSCQHINAFFDMHDVGDLMVAAGIADPVLDTERITVTYSSLDALLAELVGLGFINVLQGRRRGLTAPAVRQRLARHYPVNSAGGVDATLELVVAHGWSGQTKPPEGEFHFPIDKLKLR